MPRSCVRETKQATGIHKAQGGGPKRGKMGWGDAKSSVLNRFSLFLLFFFSYQSLYVRIFVLALYTEKIARFGRENINEYIFRVL